MTADLLAALARCNIAAGAGILVVMALRAPLRRWFGAGRAYAAWLIVPLTALGSLMPTRLSSDAAGPVEAANDRVVDWLSTGGHARALALFWLVGALAA